MTLLIMSETFCLSPWRLVQIMVQHLHGYTNQVVGQLRRVDKFELYIKYTLSSHDTPLPTIEASQKMRAAEDMS